MWNRTLKPTGQAKPGKTGELMSPGLGWARQVSVGRVLRRVWNRTNLLLRIQPGPLARYPDPLLPVARTWRLPDYHDKRHVR